MDSHKPGGFLPYVRRVWMHHHWELSDCFGLKRLTYIAKGKLWKPNINIIKDGNVGFTWTEIINNKGKYFILFVLYPILVQVERVCARVCIFIVSNCCIVTVMFSSWRAITWENGKQCKNKQTRRAVVSLGTLMQALLPPAGQKTYCIFFKSSRYIIIRWNP